MKIQDLYTISNQSVSASVISLLEKKSESCVTSLFKRTLLPLLLLLTAAVDLLWWTVMTITVYPAVSTGLAHLANLTSTLALFALSLAIPFGYTPKRDFIRPFCQLGAVGELVSPFGADDDDGEGPRRAVSLGMVRQMEETKHPKLDEWREIANRRFQAGDFRVMTNYNYASVPMILPPTYFFENYLRLGCDPNQRNSKGQTPLICAIQHFASPTEIGKILELADHQIDAQDQNGFDALTYALASFPPHFMNRDLPSLRGIEIAKRLISKFPILDWPQKAEVTAYHDIITRKTFKNYYFQPNDINDLQEFDHNPFIRFLCQYIREHFQVDHPSALSIENAQFYAREMAERYDELSTFRQQCLQPYVEEVNSAISPTQQLNVAEIVVGYL